MQRRTFIASTALAIQAFQQDFHRLPDSLNELTPAYLADVPFDPFAPPGTPLSYFPDLSPPRVFSIGIWGVFDGLPDLTDKSRDVFGRNLASHLAHHRMLIVSFHKRVGLLH